MSETMQVKVRSTDASRIYDDLIPVSLLDGILNEVKQGGFRYGWRSHPTTGFGHWNTDIVFADRDNEVDREGELIANEDWPNVFALWQFLKVALDFETISLLRCYINAMTYGTDGYPHVDSTRSNEETLMVYLCQEWKREWAGETCIWDEMGEEIEVAVTPRPGRVVIFDGRRLHRANAVSRICPDIRLTLMFKVAHEP
jgi:hypothetical protein